MRSAPQLPANLNIPEQAQDVEYRQDDEPHDVENEPSAVVEGYQIELPPHIRHRGLAIVMAITSLALVGTAGTFGYREMFGGSVVPIPPPIICSGLEDAGGDCVILKNCHREDVARAAGYREFIGPNQVAGRADAPPRLLAPCLGVFAARAEGEKTCGSRPGIGGEVRSLRRMLGSEKIISTALPNRSGLKIPHSLFHQCEAAGRPC